VQHKEYTCCGLYLYPDMNMMKLS